MTRLCVLALLVACKMNEKPAPGATPAAAPAHSTYCPGTAEWPAGTHTCTSDGACGADERCYPDGIPDMSGVCGAPVPDQLECQVDHDCKRGQICEGSIGRCGSRVSTCVPGCTATSCEAGMSCGKDLRCAPIACSDGYACGSGMRCGSGKFSDPHGCAMIPCWDGGMSCGPLMECVRDVGCRELACKTATDCPCGSCFQGACRARPGVCGPINIPAPA